MTNIGFDNEKYLEEQSQAIIEKAKAFNNKLYLEFGGKLAFDYHAARVLPGYDPNVKIKLLQRLKDKIDIVICIYAGDIERKKMRADFGIAYDEDTLRIIDSLRSKGLEIKAVVVTRYNDQPTVKTFINKLLRRNVTVHTHRAIQGYPNNVDVIVSDDGYGANSFIQTEKPIVIVTGPGPSSGKMATCLSQVYHEKTRGIAAGYAKFETFPVWNLPLNHPVNLAYEAATADIADVNMIDPFHMDSYNIMAVNYNRDIETFPVLKKICEKIIGNADLYKSPTDMGVNRVGFAICDDDTVREAAKQEVLRRYFRCQCEYALGGGDLATIERVQRLMDNLKINEFDRNVIKPARDKEAQSMQKANVPDDLHSGAALELPDGTIITGRHTSTMHSPAGCILNAIKYLSKLPEDLLLISHEVIASTVKLKTEILNSSRTSLDVNEALIALSVCVPHDDNAKIAMDQLRLLKGCEMHLTHIPMPGDEAGLRKLGINLTCDPRFVGRDLFMN